VQKRGGGANRSYYGARKGRRMSRMNDFVESESECLGIISYHIISYPHLIWYVSWMCSGSCLYGARLKIPFDWPGAGMWTWMCWRCFVQDDFIVHNWLDSIRIQPLSGFPPPAFRPRFTTAAKRRSQPFLNRFSSRLTLISPEREVPIRSSLTRTFRYSTLRRLLIDTRERQTAMRLSWAATVRILLYLAKQMSSFPKTDNLIWFVRFRPLTIFSRVGHHSNRIYSSVSSHSYAFSRRKFSCSSSEQISPSKKSTRQIPNQNSPIEYYPKIKVIVVDGQQSLGEVPEPVVVDIGNLLPCG
jgi:hypothetical protein